MSFSKVEIEAAWQLLQLSRDHKHRKKFYSFKGSKAEQSQGNTTDVSSIISEEIFGEDDAYLKGRKKRFRSINYIYKATEPLDFVNAKRKRLS